MKAIQSELGDKDGVAGEVAEYRRKFAEMNLPEEVLTKTEKELDRLQKMQQGSAEGSVPGSVAGSVEGSVEGWVAGVDGWVTGVLGSVTGVLDSVEDSGRL